MSTLYNVDTYMSNIVHSSLILIIIIITLDMSLSQLTVITFITIDRVFNYSARSVSCIGSVYWLRHVLVSGFLSESTWVI